jgi:1-deoxy-D-xylulose-5-phosphate reductoisomerase
MNSDIKTITILGSTGSIGFQVLDVLKTNVIPYKIAYMTINTRIDLLEEQLQRFNPIGVVITDEKAYKEFKNSTSFKGEILCGEEGVIEAASYKENDIVYSALVGFSGVLPTLAAIESNNNVALANKETLVSAGKIITQASERNNVAIIAVDSEHSAILQCIAGEKISEIEKIILTASGGPFRETPLEDFKKLDVAEALLHPNWTMGNKITIDSATMMNKGFEVIEAYWLFKIPHESIEVVIHPQSIIHSLVQFIDGSVKAQLSLPDMRIPIAYALSYPRRLKSDFPRLNLTELSSLEFYQPDYERYPCLRLAFDAIKINGTATAIVNAANEIAVAAFLKEKIRFTDIPICIDYALNKINIIANPSLDDIIQTDSETRVAVQDYIINEIRKSN